VAQNKELEFLRAVAAREQQDKREQAAGDDIDERHEHRQPPRTGRPTLPGPPANPSPAAPRLTIEFVHPTGLPVDDVRTATRGFSKCERLMSAPVASGPSESRLRSAVADDAALREPGELAGTRDHVLDVLRGDARPSLDGRDDATSAPSARSSWKPSSVKRSAITINAW
jgi:hypothetical protein